MARNVMVQYKVKADRIAEHESLIRDVFAELARTEPAGIRYGAFKRPDGLGFVHVAVVSITIGVVRVTAPADLRSA